MADAIGSLVSQLEKALQANQSTIEQLKVQLNTQETPEDAIKEYEWGMEYMAKQQRQMNKQYQETIDKMREMHSKNVKSIQNDVSLWQKRYATEKKKNEQLYQLIQKMGKTMIEDIDNYPSELYKE